MSLPFIVSAPGRICLFGEHQDYLGLPVIAAAISLRLQIEGHLRSDRQVQLTMPDIHHTESFNLQSEIPYGRQRDYYKSVLNLLQRQGAVFPQGFDARISSTIPINAGTSSSSALVVAWAYYLTQLIDFPLSIHQLADLAYRAEVEEFEEPGGRMDQTSSAVGQVIYLESQPVPKVETLKPIAGTFVLGDSQQAKDTLGVLKHVKYGMLEAIRKIKAADSSFSLPTYPAREAERYQSLLTPDEYILLKGNLSDRDILREAKDLLARPEPDPKQFGDLLNRHQYNLREAKRISTAKIDRMIDVALEAGALGAKINGSGGGGCMFAYAPTHAEAVAEAIERAGGKSYIITIDEGVRTETQLAQV
ncbi:GHMP kinase [Siphonobacter sp. BAB-5405]|uniref:GHMP family kinase ATP-binding protein n=1 Tax=Siphonobacter sp. BAB-5405 TaxID=1864825 RepID=UPI000C80A19E|nr:galactokinase family protein [Siphonobacter sp. BAB-5405]PMD92124.1 GHMP kinase [Siphonobacter sp. BAB-5405]